MRSSHITLTSKDGGTFGAYLALPAQPNGGTVVVLQEIFGINANIRGVADSFAAAGYVAIAPDLFWRQEPGVELDPSSEKERERASALLKGLDQPKAVEDALVAADYVKTLPGANGKVGAVGYCLGGKLAYLLATQPGIDAAISYYGVGIQGALDRAADVRCKLILHIAEADQLCPPEAQDKIEQAMAPFSDLITIVRHAKVGHAFARRGSPVYDANAAHAADQATMALLGSAVAN